MPFFRFHTQYKSCFAVQFEQILEGQLITTIGTSAIWEPILGVLSMGAIPDARNAI
jgi:hypothetical protein